MSFTDMYEPIDDDAAAAEAEKVSAKLHKLLAGKHPIVQGAVLAEALAMWIGGHRSLDGNDVEDLHKALIEAHVAAVRALLRIEAQS